MADMKAAVIYKPRGPEYDHVKAYAANVYDRIRGIGGAVMPPPPPRGKGPWPKSRIDVFGKWIAYVF